VGRAKSKKATAIIPMTTAREKDVGDKSELESYLVGQVGRGKSAKMFVPDYFWTELKIGQHKPAIFRGKQLGGSGNTNGL